MSQFSDVELYEGKSLSDLFKEIHTNHINRKTQIQNLISSLTPLIEGIGDATLLVPLIKDYLDIGVKNDEQLIKMAQIVQRLAQADKKDSDFDIFSEFQNALAEDVEEQKEIEEVSKNVEEVTKNNA